MRIWGVVCLVWLSLVACERMEKRQGKVLAEVYDKKLYLQELKQEKPLGLSSSDSLLWCKNFVSSWVKSELLLREAENSLSTTELDIDRQLEEYRKSLLIYRYQSTLRLSVDTAISPSEIKNQHPSYPEEDTCSADLVKGVYLKFPWSRIDVNTIIRYSQNKKFEELTTYGKNYAIEMADYTQEWVDLPKLLNCMPNHPTMDKTYFLNKNYVDSSDTKFYYFLCVYNLNNNAPHTNDKLDFHEDDIRNTIMYKRKQETLKQLEDQLREQAEVSNNIKIY